MVLFNGGSDRTFYTSHIRPLIRPISIEQIDPVNPRPFTTYKYVDIEHADAIANGSLKIGTLGGYADLDDLTRQDGAEGTAYHRINGIQFTGQDEQGINAALSVNLDVSSSPNATITIQGCGGYQVTPPAYCFCLSTVPDSASLLGTRQQAVFEIVDTFRLAQVLRTKHAAKLGSIRYGLIQYTGRLVQDYQLADRVPAWLRKDASFSQDREFRVVFFPVEGVSPEWFITPQDPEIAAFFRRIK